ncbi:VOC family protein [Enterobacteriaceae bacterium BIT-l23]|uniref:VOC family protein n=1 Tax=Jejubacter sp. L23 TaxID=3092086 RepID=UPI001584DBA2|nr:VOC family protein [Enterobacteriaceae bacterium BIT-l23]
MNNIMSWFEIPVRDMARATAFYEGMLGITLRPEEMPDAGLAVFPYQEPAPGGALTQGQDFTPGTDGPVIYLVTDDIEGAVARACRQGGRCCFGPLALEGIGTIARIIDSEGNRIGLHQAL